VTYRVCVSAPVSCSTAQCLSLCSTDQPHSTSLPGAEITFVGGVNCRRHIYAYCTLHAALPVCRYPTAMHAQQHSAFCQTSFFRVSKRAGENNREIWGLTVWEELETILKAGAYIDHAAEQVSNKCIAVRKVATLLRELTCHMGSHSVTCHPAGTRLKRPRRTHVECSQLNTYKWCIQNKEVTETTSTSMHADCCVVGRDQQTPDMQRLHDATSCTAWPASCAGSGGRMMSSGGTACTLQLRHDTIRDAILTCARKPT